MNSLLITSENTDSVVMSVIKQFKGRADFGMKKYGPQRPICIGLDTTRSGRTYGRNPVSRKVKTT